MSARAASIVAPEPILVTTASTFPSEAVLTVTAPLNVSTITEGWLDTVNDRCSAFSALTRLAIPAAQPAIGMSGRADNARVRPVRSRWDKLALSIRILPRGGHLAC